MGASYYARLIVGAIVRRDQLFRDNGVSKLRCSQGHIRPDFIAQGAFCSLCGSRFTAEAVIEPTAAFKTYARKMEHAPEDLWCEWQGDDSTDGFALCSARAVQCSMDHSTDTFILGIRVLEMAAEGEEADLTGFSLAELGEEAVRVRQLLDDLGLKSAKVQVFTTMYVSV